MEKILWVGIGGFLGASMRHLIADFVVRIVGDSGFPHGTLTVNLIGSMLIGFLLHLAATQEWFSPELKLLLVTGFLGALTTFSTFGNDAVSLMQKSQHNIAFFYLGVHLLFGLGAVWLGQALAALVVK